MWKIIVSMLRSLYDTPTVHTRGIIIGLCELQMGLMIHWKIPYLYMAVWLLLEYYPVLQHIVLCFFYWTCPLLICLCTLIIIWFCSFLIVVHENVNKQPKSWNNTFWCDFHLLFGTLGIYGAMAVAGRFICSLSGIDCMGGFDLSLNAIVQGLGYAAPPIMALLFILDVWQSFSSKSTLSLCLLQYIFHFRTQTLYKSFIYQIQNHSILKADDCLRIDSYMEFHKYSFDWMVKK